MEERTWRKGDFKTRVEHQMRQANMSWEWRTTGGCGGGTW